MNDSHSNIDLIEALLLTRVKKQLDPVLVYLHFEAIVLSFALLLDCTCSIERLANNKCSICSHQSIFVTLATYLNIVINYLDNIDRTNIGLAGYEAKNFAKRFTPLHNL